MESNYKGNNSDRALQIGYFWGNRKAFHYGIYVFLNSGTIPSRPAGTLPLEAQRNTRRVQGEGPGFGSEN